VQVAQDGCLIYSPEADLVMKALKWEDVPMIGLGEVGKAAERIGCLPDQIAKPSPVQAVGAILAAVNGKGVDAIEAAWRVVKLGEDPRISRDTSFVIHVYDDTSAGLRSVEEAVKILRSSGMKVELRKFGITDNHVKAEQLFNSGVFVYQNINDALMNSYDEPESLTN